MGKAGNMDDAPQRRDHITEGKQFEQARLLDLSNDAIIFRDAQNRITFWNRGAEELFGWTAAEAIGQDLHTLLKTEFELPYEELMAKLLAHNRLTGEVVQTTRDGRRLTLLCRWALDRDQQGRPQAVLTTTNDITERKRIERALRESEEDFRAMFNVSSSGTQQADVATRRFLRVNAAFCAITGYTESELLTMTVDDLNHPDDRERDREIYGRMARAERRTNIRRRNATCARTAMSCGCRRLATSSGMPRVSRCAR